jgi:predicted nucleotidyltransferase
MSSREFQTPFPEVNAVLEKLLTSAQAILENQFVGMYLYGSLSSGDFHPETSDIDFLIVTSNALSDEIVSEVEAMHKGLWESGLKWTKKLEGSYLPKDEMRRHDPSHPPHPCLNEGRFYLAGEESDWIINRHVICDQGLVLAGPNPKTLIDPVAPNEIQGAIASYLREWWKPMLDHTARLDSSEYQSYAVLSMCRALYTLEHGAIASKPVSAHWAQQKFGEPWPSLIDLALDWQPDTQLNIKNNTLNFIRFTLEQYHL